MFKLAYSADGVATLVQVDANGVLVNTELPAAAALSDTIGNPTSPMVGGASMLWDTAGSVWRRASVVNAVGGSNVPMAIGEVVWNGSSAWNPVQASAAFGDAGNGLYAPVAAPVFFNGTNYDRAYGTAANGMDVDVTRMPKVAAATLANVASSATNVTLQASNAARVGLIIFNDSTASLFVKYGATASATSFTYKLNPGAQWEMPQPVYTGIVDGIWSAANGFARMTEL